MLPRSPSRSVPFSPGLATAPALVSDEEPELHPARVTAASRPATRPVLMRCCIFMSQLLGHSQSCRLILWEQFRIKQAAADSCLKQPVFFLAFRASGLLG